MGVCITKDMLSQIKEEYEKNKLIFKGTNERNGKNIIESTNNNDYTKKLKSLFLRSDNSINFNENDNDKINYILFRKHKSCELLHSKYLINLNKIEDKKEILNSVINVNRKNINNINNLSENDSSSTYSDYIDISKHPLLKKNENTNKKEIIKDLTYDKNAQKIRNSYYYKLIIKNVWKIEKEKTMNNLFFFDWDDTLMCTSYLAPLGMSDGEQNGPAIDWDIIKSLDMAASKLLSKALEKGQVFIVTNAAYGWVEYSSNKFFPITNKLLDKIKILSARGLFEKKYPGDNRQWKAKTFILAVKESNINTDLLTNIFCFGDNIIEIEGSHKLKQIFSNAFVKTVKFKECPQPSELIKEIKIILSQFDTILSNARNLSVKVAKKKFE